MNSFKTNTTEIDLYEKIVESFSDALAVTNPSGDFLYVNKKFKSVFEDIQKNNISVLFDEKNKDNIFKKVLKKHNIYQQELKINYGKGKTNIFFLDVVQIQGKTRYLIWIFSLFIRKYKDHNFKLLKQSIENAGIGIKNELKSKVFDRFNQGDISFTSVTEGAGMGLAISKAYVELLGGDIWLKSKHYEGSSFYFSLPYTWKFIFKMLVKE